MSTLVVRGRRRLSGTLAVAGSKNAALPLIAAAAASRHPWRLTNLPAVEDVAVQLSLFERLGGTVRRRGSTVELAMVRAPKSELDPDLARRLRASILFVPALLARTGRAVFPHPGGCVIGTRPIDLFLEGFRSLGATIRVRRGGYALTLRRRSGRYHFPVQSHTGSEALAVLAAATPGTAVLGNMAVEPEVEQVLDVLRTAGARTTRGDTHTVRITGRRGLGPVSVRVIPDRIEAGTFLTLAALAGPNLTITGFNPAHLDGFTAYLERLGIRVVRRGAGWGVRVPKTLRPLELRTHEYPGFPTDLQPPFAILLTQAQGVSLVHETIYEGRLMYLDKLRAMGAKVLLADPHRAVIVGPTPLSGASLESPDIRAGIALVLAGLIAKGTTRIDHAELIQRGYERITERLVAIGADVRMR